MPMKRLNFYLTDEQLTRLHTQARQRDISVAELVRRFIDQGLMRLGVPSALGEGVVLAEMQRHLAEVEANQQALLRRIEERETP